MRISLLGRNKRLYDRARAKFMSSQCVTIPQLATGAFYCFGLRTRVALSEPVQIDAGIYASPDPPFYVDDWWQEQLGKIQVKRINSCSLFLLALTDDPAFESFLSGRLQSYHLALLLQGVAYSSNGNQTKARGWYEEIHIPVSVPHRRKTSRRFFASRVIRTAKCG